MLPIAIKANIKANQASLLVAFLTGFVARVAAVGTHLRKPLRIGLMCLGKCRSGHYELTYLMNIHLVFVEASFALTPGSLRMNT
jgi:hypothetical protein